MILFLIYFQNIFHLIFVAIMFCFHSVFNTKYDIEKKLKKKRTEGLVTELQFFYRPKTFFCHLITMTGYTGEKKKYRAIHSLCNFQLERFLFGPSYQSLKNFIHLFFLLEPFFCANKKDRNFLLNLLIESTSTLTMLLHTFWRNLYKRTGIKKKSCKSALLRLFFFSLLFFLPVNLRSRKKNRFSFKKFFYERKKF